MGEANHADCVESGRCGKARCLFHFWLRDWFVAGRLSEDLHFALSQNLATPVYMFTGVARFLITLLAASNLLSTRSKVKAPNKLSLDSSAI